MTDNEFKYIPDKYKIARPIEEWGEDYGDCLWWKFPIEEPPYCGNPLDCFWTENNYDNYYTHFTRIIEPILKENDNILLELYNELTPYQKIEKFIKDNLYTYIVEDIIEEYKTKWGKAYVSYAMKHCIENLELVIQEYIKENENNEVV